MAQLDGTQRLSEIDNYKTPTSQNSPTFQQLLQGEAAVWPANASPVAKKHHDQKEDQTTPKKCTSLSGKKQHGLESQDGSSTPPCGATLEDDDNPEYLGAPMYESESAPENFKHQHPQEAPVVTEKHVLERSVKHEAVKGKKEQPSGPNKQFTKSASEKLEPTYAAASEFASHKPAQSYTSVSDVTQTVNETAEATKDGSTIASAQEVDTGNNAGKGMLKLDGSPESTEDSTNSPPPTFDKGVSVKEYLMHKLEPGEDERALSQVISDAISPRRSPGDIGVLGKMKEAVTSLLRPEQEPSQSTTKTADSLSNNTTSQSSLSPSNTSSLSDSSPAPISMTKTNSSSNISQKSKSATNANSSPRIPISTNPYEVVQEGNLERILQTN
ncbi:hypothetical protein LguiB_031156 [Lonicera macranthoides]